MEVELMQTTKQKVLEWIQSLPDDCTLDDIRYHLYFREKVEAGTAALENGQVLSLEEAKRRMAAWQPSNGQSQR
jgi:hypothetical protein